MTWLNSIVHGVFLGGYYALLATGLSLMFGVMRIINLAHGSLALLAAYMGVLLVDHADISPYLAIAVVLPGAFIVGYILQRAMLERSLRAGVLVPLLTTFGLLIVIGNLLQRFFSPNAQSLNPGGLNSMSWQVTSTISISAFEALVFGVAVLVLSTLQLFLSYTPLGRRLRATAQDSDTAELVGINSRRTFAWAAGIAVATASLAGIFYGLRTSFDPNAGGSQLIFAFEAVVIGGIGSLWGTLAGGIVLGVAQTIGAQVNTQYNELFGHGVFLAVLIVRTWLRAGGVELLRRGILRGATS